MRYIFVVNGLLSKIKDIDGDLAAQLVGKLTDYLIYHTKGIGDGIRYVRVYCDLHRNEDVCFVACGGTGTVYEVASGIVGFTGKSMAVLAYGATDDFTKNFPECDFTSFDKILACQSRQIDIIRINDNYCLNVINIGFDANVAYLGYSAVEKGVDAVRAYKRAIIRGVLSHRVNNITVYADGKRLNRRKLLLCTVSNGRWCGGQFKCSPRAELDDGLIEVCLFHPCSLLTFIRLVRHYSDGTYLEDPVCRKHICYCRAKHVEIKSKGLTTICIDGEFTTSSHFDADILPKAITIYLPPK